MVQHWNINAFLGIAVSAICFWGHCQSASVEEGVLPDWNVLSVGLGDELTQRLSTEAKIHFPGSNDFNASQVRWSALEAPDFAMAVEVANQNDVVETVKWANAHNLPFLAVNTGHGSLVSMGKLKNGVQIWTRQLTSISIADDGKTATFGAGVRAKGVIDALWAAGKQTATGGCECVGILGPGLGGGHSFLQGRLGLIGDQFVSFDMVLADGSIATVDRDHELWWAMRGAGHNFGIVTSFTSKIYDVTHPKWAQKSFIFAQDKLEDFYKTVNEKILKDGAQPVDVIIGSTFQNNPALDPNDPVIATFILQEGVDAVDEIYTAPFTALGPLVAVDEGGDYRDIPRWTANTLDGPLCTKRPGYVNSLFPLDLQTYDVPAQRQVYDLFSRMIKEIPAMNNSIFVFEGYSTQGVKAVPAEDTAYPYRESNLLVAPLIVYPEGKELNEKAEKFGNELRDVLHKASGQKKMRTYVNYSFGNEGPLNWYGDEQWRQDRLRALKQKFDSLGKFSFYAPIA